MVKWLSIRNHYLFCKILHRRPLTGFWLRLCWLHLTKVTKWKKEQKTKLTKTIVVLVVYLALAGSYNPSHIILRLFDAFFFSSEVKRSVIISNKHRVKLPDDLPNDLRLRILGNSEISGKSLKLSSIQSFFQIGNFVNTSTKPFENENWTFPVVHYFTQKLDFISNISSKIVDK